MDNLDDSETNAKVSDSAYSNSCSNSQSRRSHSSKSTHSGSNSSGSSGYGGKQLTSGSSKTLSIPEKRTKDKDGKKKKPAHADLVKIQADVEFRLPEPAPITATKEEPHNAVPPSLTNAQSQKGPPRAMETTEENTDEDLAACKTLQLSKQIVTSKPCSSLQQFTVSENEGFSCVISMHDGVVLYMSQTLTPTLGFPKEMWIGRSFIDFIHPLDHDTFASQITTGLAVPKKTNGMQNAGNFASTMFCRLRMHRGLDTSFSVKDRTVTYRPFMLKISFKSVHDEKGSVLYLVIQAMPLFSAFKIPNELIVNAVPFIMRHAANGNLEYIDNEAIPFLGYLPQEITGRDVLKLYHPEDLAYMRHMYETIVKQGRAPRSKPYRLMTQNGHYLKLETEWSSFINPWSKKLEFVIGKNHVIEGPTNPNVFQASPPGNDTEEEDKTDIKDVKESIKTILNELPTRPVELARQQMTKRCQELASFMESLIEEQPKVEEELRLEIQENDTNYFERDSVMLGGISPHHEYNDSKSSTESPLSYNQLNFNINLKRYFDSHLECDKEILESTDTNLVPMKGEHNTSGECMMHDNLDWEELISGKTPSQAPPEKDQITLSCEYQAIRLTESLLTKHNSNMEKKIVKIHRESRASNKEEREKISNESKQKKKDHLVRCNASFVPTTVNSIVVGNQPHGQKRASKECEVETGSHKQHCSTPRHMHRRRLSSSEPMQPSDTVATVSSSSSMWTPNLMTGMNPFMSQQVPLVNPLPSLPGLVPVYYVPTTVPAVQSSSSDVNKNTGQQNQAPGVQYMMYGQVVFGSPFIVTPAFPLMQSHYASVQNNIKLPNNFEEGLPLKWTGKSHLAAFREKKRAEAASAAASAAAAAATAVTATANATAAAAAATAATATATATATAAAAAAAAAVAAAALPGSSKQGQGHSSSSTTHSGTNALDRSTEAAPGSSASQDSKMKNEETVDRTDGESSYSSFYSSFFKTESGSADDSGDAKKSRSKSGSVNSGAPNDCLSNKQMQRRKMEPPWMEHVCVTSELVYKYQVLTKSLDEVLLSDKNKLLGLQQPLLVNEQLGQLYMDLQLEGVAGRLTLEDGITSSGSSSEENTKKLTIDTLSKRARRKRRYTKLVIIHEEDAPLPPPDDEEESKPSTLLA